MSLSDTLSHLNKLGRMFIYSLGSLIIFWLLKLCSPVAQFCQCIYAKNINGYFNLIQGMKKSFANLLLHFEDKNKSLSIMLKNA